MNVWGIDLLAKRAPNRTSQNIGFLAFHATNSHQPAQPAQSSPTSPPPDPQPGRGMPLFKKKTISFVKGRTFMYHKCIPCMTRHENGCGGKEMKENGGHGVMVGGFSGARRHTTVGVHVPNGDTQCFLFFFACLEGIMHR